MNNIIYCELIYNYSNDINNCNCVKFASNFFNSFINYKLY